MVAGRSGHGGNAAGASLRPDLRRCDRRKPTHILVMPRSSSPDTLDLFDLHPTAPDPAFRQAPSTGNEVPLSDLSDRALARLLGNVMSELERRAGQGQSDPELAQALPSAQSVLERLTGVPKRPGRPACDTGSPPLQPAVRKAVLAALVAGVKPVQVAKHFGLSVPEVRRVLAGTD
jgi:DNA-directed RNA polymerase specialized sigma24 family protein